MLKDYGDFRLLIVFFHHINIKKTHSYNSSDVFPLDLTSTSTRRFV